ncbi:MAG: GNAT family N-acetyltransferase [Candidatus Bipolaricaulota bacterium]
MSLRPIRLPQDLIPAADMLMQTFQYPDHPEWGVQSDEQAALVDSIRRMRRIWPIVRALQLVSPSLRDLARGFVFEEGGRLVGLTLANREGLTSCWYIGTVGVLPGFRGRGIARQVLTATLEMMRKRRGERVRLGVINGNTPAQALYRSLGFADYGGSTRYAREAGSAPEPGALSERYEETPLREFDWRTRYELDRRIVPAEQQAYEPIVPARYRTPAPIRLLAPLFRLAENTKDRDVVVRDRASGQVVARCGWTWPRTPKGMNSVRVRVDPAHAALSSYLVRRGLAEVTARRPELRVDLFVPTWMPDAAREAEALGFTRRTSNRLMGMKL